MTNLSALIVDNAENPLKIKHITDDKKKKKIFPSNLKVFDTK